nr:hypothetical protein [Tanacetum cinerariifolium]
MTSSIFGEFYGFAVNRESALNVYSKWRIIAITDLKIVEWHSYKNLYWITIRRDDDKLYKFKEGDFKRLRLQDIKDTLLLLVQVKLTNLTVKERFAFNVSLRKFTRSIVIQRRMEDLQLGVESYQNRLNLTKPDTYRSDLKRRKAYTAYSNPRGFIYQNKDTKNRLMRIDKLHKFSDGTLNDVCTALDDRLKGIRMEIAYQKDQPRIESIFETTSRIDVQTPTFVAPLPITTPTMTSSTIATTTPTSQAPNLPTTILSKVIQHLPSFGLLFRFDDRLRTSYAVAADLSEMELKKILIEKMERNKSIQRSYEQRNLYKALIDAYESNKIILDTYEETVTLKRRRDDDEDKDEEPSAGPDWGLKRQREGKEPESASAPTETTTRSAGRSTQGSRSRKASANESALAEEPLQTTSQMEEPSHLEFDTDNRGRRVIPFAYFINNDLEYLLGGASIRKYTTSVTKTKAADYKHIKEPPIGDINVSSSTVSLLTGNLLAMYILREESLLSQKSKLWNGIATSTWIGLCIVIQRRVEDLQLGVESYQKRLNLTKLDNYRSDLKCKKAYTAYSNPRGFIYQNKDKKNRLMRTDELYKFNDGTLTDVRTALDN